MEEGNTTEEITTQPFPGYRRAICRLTEVTNEALRDLLIKYVHPTQVNGIHCSETITGKIQQAYRSLFSATNVKIRYAPLRLEDLTDEEGQLALIRETHERAHRGIEENMKQLLLSYYFPKMKESVRQYINVCDICNKSKYDRHPLVNKLQDTPIPRYPYEIIHVDIFKIEGQLFLSSLDKLSKFA